MIKFIKTFLKECINLTNIRTTVMIMFLTYLCTGSMESAFIGCGIIIGWIIIGWIILTYIVKPKTDDDEEDEEVEK